MVRRLRCVHAMEVRDWRFVTASCQLCVCGFANLTSGVRRGRFDRFVFVTIVMFLSICARETLRLHVAGGRYCMKRCDSMLRVAAGADSHAFISILAAHAVSVALSLGRRALPTS